jgi:hypothetical protein
LPVLAALVLSGSLVVIGARAHAGTPVRRLPPDNRDALARIFDPPLRKLGLRTTRARLQNLRTYETDPRGRHLAVYVEPIDDTYADADYVANFAAVARVFLPMVYDRWNGLESFDVCQEPRQSDDPRPEPPPVTQLVVTRAAREEVRWKHATLADVLTVAAKHMTPAASQHDFSVYMDGRLESQPALVDARATAARKGS